MNPRPPLPPFTEETAREKVQAAEDAWNSRDPDRVTLAYTEDTHWRIAPSLSTAARRSSSFCGANGIANWIIG